jgi:hypothetical protein
MKKITLLTCTALFLVATYMQAQDVINPVSATSTLATEFGSSLDNTINGNGLDAFPSLAATHAMTSPGNAYYATNDTGAIDFDLGGSYLVEGFSFWNINAPGPGQAGIQGVVVSSSEDGVTYTPIAGSPTIFAQVTSGTTSAEIFSFTAVTASFIRLDIVSNYGDPGNLVAFAEIAFSGTDQLSVNDNILAAAISLYPNPASDVFTISNTSDFALKGIQIYDMNGRLVRQRAMLDNSPNQAVIVSELSPGIYSVHIYGDQAKSTKKLIKKQ